MAFASDVVAEINVSASNVDRGAIGGAKLHRSAEPKAPLNHRVRVKFGGGLPMRRSEEKGQL